MLESRVELKLKLYTTCCFFNHTVCMYARVCTCTCITTYMYVHLETLCKKKCMDFLLFCVCMLFSNSTLAHSGQVAFHVHVTSQILLYPNFFIRMIVGLRQGPLLFLPKISHLYTNSKVPTTIVRQYAAQF